MNTVVFVTINICTINLFLLFDNTTVMTHFKIRVEGLKWKGWLWEGVFKT